MTPQEALKIRKNPHFEDVDNEELSKCIDEALEKQKPKKPKFYDTKFRQRGMKYGEYVTIEKAYNCPNCNCTVWEKDKSSFCEQCGQALDWSEE